MSGDAFVIGDRFVVDERAFRKVGGGDDNATGALAIWRASDVMRCGGGLKGGNGFDRHRRFREESEEFGKFRLHLGNVAAEIVEDLICGSWNVFGICFERRAEGGKV